MRVFWRLKGSKDGVFHEGELMDRRQGLLKLSLTRFGMGFWYKEDEIEMISEETEQCPPLPLIEYDGLGAILMNDISHSPKVLLQLLGMRRDKRYRTGMIQCAVSFHIIGNHEYEVLKGQIDRGERCKLFFDT